MIRYPAHVKATVAQFMVKARRQLLWSDGTFDGHAIRRSQIAVEIAAHIDCPVRSVVDIGCGLAVTTAALACELLPNDIMLIDGDGSIDLRPLMNNGVQLRDARDAWADVKLGVAIVRANTSATVRTAGPNDDFGMPVDLIVSTRALTYHFPLIEYVTRINRWLSVGGYIFLETKRDVDIVDLAERCGLNLSVVYKRRTGKCELLLCKRV